MHGPDDVAATWRIKRNKSNRIIFDEELVGGIDLL